MMYSNKVVEVDVNPTATYRSTDRLAALFESPDAYESALNFIRTGGGDDGPGAVVSAWDLLEHVLTDLGNGSRLSDETASVLSFLNLLMEEDDIVLISDMGCIDFVSSGLHRPAATAEPDRTGGDQLHPQRGIEW